MKWPSESAHEQARTRAREERLGKTIDGNRPGGHWDTVRREIAWIWPVNRQRIGNVRNKEREVVLPEAVV